MKIFLYGIKKFSEHHWEHQQTFLWIVHICSTGFGVCFTGTIWADFQGAQDWIHARSCSRVAGSEKYPFLSCCSLPSPYGHLRCSSQQAVLTPFRTELVVWGTGTWKPTCQFNRARNTSPSLAAKTIPYFSAMGISAQTLYCPEKMSAQSHYFLDERLVGWVKQGDREPDMAVGSLPGQQLRSHGTPLG